MMEKLKNDIVTVLEKWGYKNIYFDTWTKDGYPSIDVKKINSIEALMNTMFAAGSTYKAWELKRVLEI